MMHVAEVKQRGCGTKINFYFYWFFRYVQAKDKKVKKIVNAKAVITFHVVLSFSWL